MKRHGLRGHPVVRVLVRVAHSIFELDDSLAPLLVIRDLDRGVILSVILDLALAPRQSKGIV